MNTSIRLASAVAWPLALCVAASAQDRPARQPTPGVNLARGKLCTFTPPPNYSLCRDDADGSQLTDGVYNGCSWTEKGTVGWQTHRSRVTLIDLDLGKEAAIGAVTFDERVGLSHSTGQITHHISADVDAERNRLFAGIKANGSLTEVYAVDDFHKIREGRNGGGDPWRTDGRLFVGVIGEP